MSDSEEEVQHNGCLISSDSEDDKEEIKKTKRNENKKKKIDEIFSFDENNEKFIEENKKEIIFTKTEDFYDLKEVELLLNGNNLQNIYKGHSKKDYYKCKKYLEIIREKNGTIKVNYSRSNNAKNGRLYADGGVQMIYGEIRKYLQQNKRIMDVDIVNSNCSIILGICKLHKMNTPYLKNYVKDRNKIIKKYYEGNKNKAKEFIMMSINARRIKTTNEFEKEFDKEMKKIRLDLSKKKEYKEELERGKQSKKGNPYGSFISKVYEKYEDEILQMAINYYEKTTKKEIISAQFDGYQAYEHTKFTIENLNEYVNKHSKIKVIFALKPIQSTIQLEATQDKVLLSQIEGAEIVLQEHKYWVLCQEILYTFDTDTGMWENSRSVLRKYVINILQHVMKTKYLTISYIDNVISFISMNEIIRNNKWLDKYSNSSLEYLLFNNGYYDGKQCKFINHFNPNIVFFEKIYADYDEKFDEEYGKSIMTRFFYLPLGKEVGNYYIQMLSCGLLGCLLKKIYFCLGETNTGKSTITNAIMASCGSYTGTFNAECLTYDKTSQDQAQKMRWTLLLRYKRLVFSNELSTESKLNGNYIKKISSGGDRIVARTHQKTEEEFVPHFMTTIFANDMCEIKPYDNAMNKRTDVIPYEKTYVLSNPNENQLLIDENIKHEINTDKFQKTFLQLMIRAYEKYKSDGIIEKPDILNDVKNNWIEQKTNIMEEFLLDFVITNNENDVVQCSKISDWMKKKNLGVSVIKSTRQLKDYCKLNNYNNVINTVKRNKKIKKCEKVWIGIKELIEDISDNDSDSSLNYNGDDENNKKDEISF